MSKPKIKRRTAAAEPPKPLAPLDAKADLLDGARQDDVLALLLFDDAGALEIRRRVPVQLFTSHAYRAIVTRAYAYIDEHRKAPKVHTDSIVEDLLKQEGGLADLIEEAMEAAHKISKDFNPSFVLGRLDDFIFAQNFKIAMVDAHQRSQSGDTKGAAADLAEKIKEAFRSDSSKFWPELDPLPEVELPAPKPFPFDALGPLLGNAARDLAANVQVPDSIAAGSVLGAASLVCQPLANVRRPRGEISPLSLYILTCAESGDRKTTADKNACDPILQHREAQAREAAVEAEESKDKKPRFQSLILSSTTVQGVINQLRYQSHIGLFTTEGSELFGGHSMTAERRSASIGFFNKAWELGVWDHNTAGDGLTVLFGRRLMINALMQPMLLDQLLADPYARGQGLMSRFLISKPASVAGDRPFTEGDPLAAKSLKTFHDALRERLARAAKQTTKGAGFELNVRAVGFSQPAKKDWVAFYNHTEKGQKAGGEFQEARAFVSKSAEHAARFAGVIKMMDDPIPSQPIKQLTMEGAIEITKHFINEHLRLTNTSVQAIAATQVHTLLGWFQSRGGLMVPNDDLLQKGPGGLRKLKAEGLHKLVDELVQRNYLRAVDGGWEVRPTG